MAKVAAGGDTKKLFKMMEQGQLDPNKYLPLFFQELEIESAGGIEAYKNSIGGSQNFAGVAFENVLGAFGGGGGNQGLINFWKDMKNVMDQLVPTAAKLGAAFKVISGAVAGLAYTVSHIVGSFSKLVDGQSSITGWATAVGGAFFLISTRMGRMTLGLGLLVGLLEDIAVYNRGGKSLIGEVLGKDNKGGAALAGLAAFMGLKGALPDGHDKGTPSKGKGGKGFLWGALLNPYTAVLGLGALTGLVQKDATEKYNMTPVIVGFGAAMSTANFLPMIMQGKGGVVFQGSQKFQPQQGHFWEWQNPVSPETALNPSVNLTINVTAQTNDGKELGKQIADQVMYIFPNR